MSPLLFTLACALGIAACIGWIAEVRRARRELDTAAGLLHRAQLREAEAKLRDIRDEIGGLRHEVRAIADDRWTTHDMDRWATKLERHNRHINLTVPDPQQVIAERK